MLTSIESTHTQGHLGISAKHPLQRSLANTMRALRMWMLALHKTVAEENTIHQQLARATGARDGRKTTTARHFSN